MENKRIINIQNNRKQNCQRRIQQIYQNKCSYIIPQQIKNKVLNNPFRDHTKLQQKQLKQDLQIHPQGFVQSHYSQVFPLGNKSYGIISQNYYGLVIANNNHIHIKRDAFPGSFLLFGNMEVQEETIFLQSINFISVGTAFQQCKIQLHHKINKGNFNDQKLYEKIENYMKNNINKKDKFYYDNERKQQLQQFKIKNFPDGNYLNQKYFQNINLNINTQNLSIKTNHGLNFYQGSKENNQNIITQNKFFEKNEIKLISNIQNQKGLNKRFISKPQEKSRLSKSQKRLQSTKNRQLSLSIKKSKKSQDIHKLNLKQNNKNKNQLKLKITKYKSQNISNYKKDNKRGQTKNQNEIVQSNEDKQKMIKCEQPNQMTKIQQEQQKVSNKSLQQSSFSSNQYNMAKKQQKNIQFMKNSLSSLDPKVDQNNMQDLNKRSNLLNVLDQKQQNKQKAYFHINIVQYNLKIKQVSFRHNICIPYKKSLGQFNQNCGFLNDNLISAIQSNRRNSCSSQQSKWTDNIIQNEKCSYQIGQLNCLHSIQKISMVTLKKLSLNQKRRQAEQLGNDSYRNIYQQNNNDSDNSNDQIQESQIRQSLCGQKQKRLIETQINASHNQNDVQISFSIKIKNQNHVTNNQKKYNYSQGDQSQCQINSQYKLKEKYIKKKNFKAKNKQNRQNTKFNQIFKQTDPSKDQKPFYNGRINNIIIVIQQKNKNKQITQNLISAKSSANVISIYSIDIKQHLKDKSKGLKQFLSKKHKNSQIYIKNQSAFKNKLKYTQYCKNNQQVTYELAQAFIYSQYLKQQQKTVVKNWLQIQRERIFIITNLNIYQINIKNLKNSLKNDIQFQQQNNINRNGLINKNKISQSNIKGSRRQSKQIIRKKQIKCKSLNMLQKIYQFQNNKMSNYNKSNNITKKKQNVQQKNNQIIDIQFFKEDRDIQNNILIDKNEQIVRQNQQNEYLIKQQKLQNQGNNSSKQTQIQQLVQTTLNKYASTCYLKIISCSWLNYRHYLVLTSNSLIYEIYNNKVVNCQDLIKIIKSSEEHETRRIYQFDTKQKNEQEITKSQNQKLANGSMLAVNQIACIRSNHKQSGMIIARIQNICDELPIKLKPHKQISINQQIKQNINKLPQKNLNQENSDNTNKVYTLQNQFHVFKYNRRWTQYYLKLDNFINQKVMNSGVSSIPVTETFNSLGGLPLMASNSNTNNNYIQKFDIHPESICLKILDNYNYISEEYLNQFANNTNQIKSQKTKTKSDNVESQIHIYCQWGINTKYPKQNIKQQTSSNERIAQNIYNSVHSFNINNTNKSLYKNYYLQNNNLGLIQPMMNSQRVDSQNCNETQKNFSRREYIKNNTDPFLFKINSNLQMFIAQVNIFGKSSKNQQDLNPLCIKLQDYYNPNLNNIFQIKYKNLRYVRYSQKQKNRLNKKVNKQNTYCRSISPYYSVSANMFNFVILSQQDSGCRLTMHQKNIMATTHPKHYLHVGLTTKPFVQNFIHYFQQHSPPKCICIDSFSLHLIAALKDKIRLYYVLKDRIMKGPQLPLQNIIYLKFDKYNWHLYAHSVNVLFIINPWKFQIERELVFEGEIQSLQIGDDYVFVRWKQKISEAVFLTVFPLYQAISQDFKTYQTQLDTMILKKELQQYLNACSLLNVSFQHKRRFSNIVTDKQRINKMLGEHIKLQCCFQAHAQTNTLFIMNQYYMQIHQMNFTSVFDRFQRIDDQEYYKEYYKNYNKNTQIQSMEKGNILKSATQNSQKSGINTDASKNRRKSKFYQQRQLKSNQVRKVNIISQKTDKNVRVSKNRISIQRKISVFSQLNKNQLINDINQQEKQKKQNQIRVSNNNLLDKIVENVLLDPKSSYNCSSQARYSLMSVASNNSQQIGRSIQSFTERQSQCSEQSQKNPQQQQKQNIIFEKYGNNSIEQQDKITRIRICLKKSKNSFTDFAKFNQSNYYNSFQNRLLRKQKQYPTFLKYESNLQTLFVGTNEGNLLAYKYRFQQKNQHKNRNIQQILYPFYMQGVSFGRIESIMFSKNILSTCMYVYTQNETIMVFRLPNSNKSTKNQQNQQKKGQAKILGNWHTIQKQPSSLSSIDNQKNQPLVKQLHNFKYFNNHYHYFPTTHTQIMINDQQQIFKQANVFNQAQPEDNNPQFEDSRIFGNDQKMGKGYSLDRLLTTCLGEHEIHTLLSNTYRLYTSQNLQKLSQQIQELELRLLKVRGDKQQFLIKTKQKYQSLLSLMEDTIHQIKVTSKMQQNRTFISGRNSLNNLQKYYQQQRKHQQIFVKSDQKNDYQIKIRAIYKQNDQLTLRHRFLTEKNRLQLEELKQQLAQQQNILQQKYYKQINEMQTNISELCQRNKEDQKIFAIQLQQTQYQYKILKQNALQRMDDLLQRQLQLEQTTNNYVWNGTKNIFTIKQKIDQLQQLSLQFRLDIQNWRQTINKKIQFYGQCENSYKKLQKQLQKKDLQFSQMKQKSKSKYQFHHRNQLNKGYKQKQIKSQYELNHIVKFLKAQIIQKQQENNEINQKGKQIESKINKISEDRLEKQIEIYNKNNSIQDRKKYLDVLKQRRQICKHTKLKSKNRCRRMLYQLWKFMDECLNQYFVFAKNISDHDKDQVKNVNHKKDKIYNTKLNLQLQKQSKYQQSYIKFINQNVANLNIQKISQLSKNTKFNKIQNTTLKTKDKQILTANNKNKIEGLMQSNQVQKQNKEISQQQQQFIQFVKFLQIIKERRDFQKIAVDLTRKQYNFANNLQKQQVYIHNKQLIAQVSKLRMTIHNLQEKLSIIKNYYTKIKQENNDQNLLSNNHNNLYNQKRKSKSLNAHSLVGNKSTMLITKISKQKKQRYNNFKNKPSFNKIKNNSLTNCIRKIDSKLLISPLQNYKTKTINYFQINKAHKCQINLKLKELRSKTQYKKQFQLDSQNQKNREKDNFSLQNIKSRFKIFSVDQKLKQIQQKFKNPYKQQGKNTNSLKITQKTQITTKKNYFPILQTTKNKKNAEKDRKTQKNQKDRQDDIDRWQDDRPNNNQKYKKIDQLELRDKIDQGLNKLYLQMNRQDQQTPNLNQQISKKKQVNQIQNLDQKVQDKQNITQKSRFCDKLPKNNNNEPKLIQTKRVGKRLKLS